MSSKLKVDPLMPNVDFLQVMVHQFGHTLGLGHSARQTSVMTPFYLDWVTEAEVGPDPGDMEAVRVSAEEPYSSGSRTLAPMMILLLTLNL